MNNSLLAISCLAAIGVMLSITSIRAADHGQDGVFRSVAEIAPPVGPGAHEPRLLATINEDVLLSWSQPSERGEEVLLAQLIGNEWSEPSLIHEADDLFVNWADYPEMAEFGDGTLAAHWLRRIGGGSYDYEINIGLSRDGGRSWSAPVVPHDDRGATQHGFVSMVPVAGNRLVVVWLDGRAYGRPELSASAGTLENPMQLRSNTLSASGVFEGDTVVDIQTCSCCQTSMTATGSGDVLVAYRDRTNAEIRDISVVRLADGVWSDPVPVHADGWQIPGCPVNGPAIDATGDTAVVAWFTAAGDLPAVKIAFSDDAGASFGEARRIDLGDPSGRVDAIMLEDGSALVSWLEWTDEGESLVVCRATPARGCFATEHLVLNQTNETMNFPIMAQAGDEIFFAWTQPLPGGDTSVRVLRTMLEPLASE